MLFCISERERKGWIRLLSMFKIKSQNIPFNHNEVKYRCCCYSVHVKVIHFHLFKSARI